MTRVESSDAAASVDTELGAPSSCREEARARIERAYELAWHAVQLAKRYASEPGTDGNRESACMARVSELRAFVRAQREVLRAVHTDEGEVRPGLRKAEPTEQTYEIRFTKKLSY